MPEGSNGNYDPLENIRALNEAARLNIDEHEKIWQSINSLRLSVLETNVAVGGLIGAIRELIDRIPPENLK